MKRLLILSILLLFPKVSAIAENHPDEKNVETVGQVNDTLVTAPEETKKAETVAAPEESKKAETPATEETKKAETVTAPEETKKSETVAAPEEPKKAETPAIEETKKAETSVTEGKKSPPKLAKAENSRRNVIVLPSTDSSGLNLAVPLQYALAQLFQQSEGFEVQISTYVLPGYTSDEVKAARDYLKSDVMSFIYFEKERLSLFLFDSKEPNSFIVVSEPLTGAPGGHLDNTFIESKFRTAYNKALENLTNNKFQPLPSSGSQERTDVAEKGEPEEVDRKVSQSRMLFRELASIQDRPIYVGGTIGMARTSAGDASASNVNFGGYAGYHIGKKYDVELGLDFFNYSTLRGDFRYHLALPRRFMHASFGFSIGQVMSKVTRTISNSGPNFESGQLIFGPTASFNVPLLGTAIRGELRIYLGGGTIISGTYGISYSL